MQKVTVNGFNIETTWEVQGNNEIACVNDIIANKRHEFNDYVRNMFKQRYGCIAAIVEQKNTR
jgi:hypothetical protein